MKLTDDYIKKMKERAEKEKLYEEARKESYLLNRNRKNELLEIVNSVLKEEGCPLITEEQIQFYPQYVGNTGIGKPIDKRLTQIIYDYYYPPAKLGLYAHFTDLVALKSILDSRKIRLTSTIKRKDEFEFKLFYEDHEITGYERPLFDSTYDESLMTDLFYISLTENKEPATDIKRGMWKYFGRNGQGVKLIFEINTEHSDFRKVYYPDQQFDANKQLLKKLNERLISTFSKPLVINSLSKIGAFYIHADFADEYETRFLIKRQSADYPFPFKIQFQNNIPYVELNFVSEWGSIIPVKVQPGKYCDRVKAQEVIDDSGLKIELLPNAESV